MFNTQDVAKSQHPYQLIPTNLDQMLLPQQNMEEITIQTSIHLEKLSDLNSFSLKNFILVTEEKEAPYELRYIQRQFDQIYSDDPLYSVLSLKRGKSEYLQDESQFAYQFFSESPTNPNTHDSNEQRKDHFDSFQEKHEGIQDSKDRSTTLNDVSTESAHDVTEKKASTKNVTKNMGKLLFKFIWKNRMQLRKQLNVENSEWQLFMGDIREWKKANNITREYLNNRWHCHGHHSKIFRTISHHFFRKRCLSAIIQSNIQNKEMHIKRFRRFQEGISDPKALDNLN